MKETTSSESGAENGIASELGAEKESNEADGGGELSDTEGLGLNNGVVEVTEAVDDCCGRKGLSLLKKFLIPSRRVPCPCEAETRERTTTDRSHSLILSRGQPPPHSFRLYIERSQSE